MVTGAGRGIGAAAALALAKAGADVVVNYLSHHDAAELTAQACREQEVAAVTVQADTSDEAETARLFAAADDLGALGVLVVNAGIWEGSPIASMTRELWNRVMSANATSAFLCCREAARRMTEGDSMILVASTAAQRGEADYSAYAASKGAIVSLVKSLATELGPRGVRVNAVAPGWVETDMTRAAIAADRGAIERAIPLRRVATPDDIAGPIAFLASRAARHITGEILNVNGGSVLVG